MALPSYGPISFSDINAELGYPGGQTLSLGSFVGSYTVRRTQRDSTDVSIYAGTYPVYHPFLNTYGVWTSTDFSTPSNGAPQTVNYTTYQPYGGTFTLTACADNSVEVYIGGNQVILHNGWSDTSSVPVTIPAGIVTIRVVARNYDGGTPGLFAALISDSDGTQLWNTRSPLDSGTIATDEVITGIGWAPYLAQGVPNPSHGNNNVDRFHGKSNTPLPPTTVGGYVNFGGFNHGPGETPHFTLTSQAARPQRITGTMSFTSGGNNYAFFEIHNQSGLIYTFPAIPPTGQVGVRNWTYTWGDTIASYASNTYWCRCYTTWCGDYNYMGAADAFNNFTFTHSQWAGN